MNKIAVHIKKLPHHGDMALPSYATEKSAGMDLMAAIKEDMIVKKGERALIPTGIAIALPNGTEAQIRPRSGLALKNGLTVLNTPGTIDADYRGEICVILANFGNEDFVVKPAMRIAQMIIAPVLQANLIEVEDLEESARGTGGFGSTGV